MAPISEDELQKIERQTEQYRARAIERAEGKRTRPTAQEREQAKRERTQQALERTETALEKADARRVDTLIRHAAALAKAGEWSDVHATALELAHLTRTMTLGYRDAHPVYSTLPPPHGPAPPSAIPSSLPARGYVGERDGES